MVSLSALWLPILIAAVLVFFASFVIHMVARYHAADYGRVSSEDDVMNALRSFAIPLRSNVDTLTIGCTAGGTFGWLSP